MLLSDRPSFSTALPTAALAATLALAGAAVHAQPPTPQPQGPQLNLPRVELSAGMHRIEAQVAQAPHERQTGLMHRRTMAQHEGMLFVFEQPATQCFWMKNTPLPLTIAFLEDDGTIVNLADMQPFVEDSHCSDKPVRYVLEMNQGWFASKGLKAGRQLRGALFSVRKPSP